MDGIPGYSFYGLVIYSSKDKGGFIRTDIGRPDIHVKIGPLDLPGKNIQGGSTDLVSLFHQSGCLHGLDMAEKGLVNGHKDDGEEYKGNQDFQESKSLPIHNWNPIK